MKIGTCIGIDDDAPLKQKFEMLRENGFDSCQILSWKPERRTPENEELLRSLIKEYGITVSAFWCGWEGPCVWNFYEGQKTIGLVPPEYREMRVGNLCEGADFAHRLGIEDVVTHMGFIPESPFDSNWEGFCDAVRRVALHCKQNGQHLLFETGQETPVTLLRCFETVGTDNLGINLDTANVILYGKANPADALDVFGKYVRNLHAKDGFYPTNGHDLGTEARIGDGKVDFRAVFTKLHELGYDRYVTIEREIEGAQQIEDVRYSKIYLEKIITEIYGEDALC